jgi:hypothetical protein
LIVGGGIHGSYLANLLRQQPDGDPDAVRILDPHADLLTVWSRNTASCGMRFLRSPATHNIDLPILSLYHFARRQAYAAEQAFIPPYNRPALALFQDHCRQVIQANGLSRIHIPARALRARRERAIWQVETTAGLLHCDNLLLAIGMGEQPCWPNWALALRASGARVTHVFDPDFNRAARLETGSTIVFGGGLSAVQTALALAAESTGRIALVARHPLRESQYDFNPCWIGPKCLRPFYLMDFPDRRTIIDRARVRGTLPGEVLDDFERVCANGRLTLHYQKIPQAEGVDRLVRLKTDSGWVEADQLILATGFHNARPGGRFIDRLIQESHLAVNPCGYPILDEALRWSEGLYATGPLAELQLGPCARNIAGARNAGRHLLRHLARRQARA